VSGVPSFLTSYNNLVKIEGKKIKCKQKTKRKGLFYDKEALFFFKKKNFTGNSYSPLIKEGLILGIQFICVIFTLLCIIMINIRRNKHQGFFILDNEEG
jgi:hypothetical protein